MRALIWTGFAVLLLIWTAVTWAAAQLAQWAAQALKGGSAPELANAGAGIANLPAWMGDWIAPELLQALLVAARWTGPALESTLPWAGAAVGLLSPLVWGGWFVVAVLLLVTAMVLHRLAGRLRKVPAQRYV